MPVKEGEFEELLVEERKGRLLTISRMKIWLHLMQWDLVLLSLETSRSELNSRWVELRTRLLLRLEVSSVCTSRSAIALNWRRCARWSHGMNTLCCWCHWIRTNRWHSP